ncbi:TIGR00153 family protein [Methanolapillus millepedarum]|uniref:DUF47 family protein n=1 Tax=Methanolapillus millepedarum TaxID=3028296 RepID=A0AA96ZUQ0_9EURY|nr:hypothetical protein MsAc7_00830 [Methanosarcinaceae archaeon Ac7]
MPFMRSVLDIFVDSPLVPLVDHASKGIESVEALSQMMDAYLDGNDAEVERLCHQIDELEHEADKIKQKFRTELPSSVVIQLDTTALLNFLKSQDSIANNAQDAANWMALRRGANLPDQVKEDFKKLMLKTVDCINAYGCVIHDLKTLDSTSYNKTEVLKVIGLIPAVEKLEHETDVCETKILREIFKYENEIGGAGVYHLSHLAKSLATIADKAASASDYLRRILAKKIGKS